MSESSVFASILLFYVSYTLIKLFVSASQINFLKKFSTDNEQFKQSELVKAKEYAYEKERFAIVEILYDLVIFCFWIFIGLSLLSGMLAATSILTQTFGVTLFLLIGFILEVPIKIWLTFGIDKRFGFTSSSKSLFVIDKLKELLITTLVGAALSFAAIYFISSFELWWFFVFLLIAFFMIGANILYPNFIAPIFNKFEKLEDKEITDGLKELARKSGFELSEIYRVDAGKRDARLNAYFAGLGRSKRVALYDTLIQKLSKEQIFAVVAHELGHFKHKHIFLAMGSMLGAFFILTYVFGSLGDIFYSSLGVVQNGAGGVVIFLIFSSPALYLAMPLINYIYKKNEYEADDYAAAMGYKEAMIEALKTLSRENKAFPYASKIKVFFDYTHPPITKRIEKLKSI